MRSAVPAWKLRNVRSSSTLASHYGSCVLGSDGRHDFAIDFWTCELRHVFSCARTNGYTLHVQDGTY